MPRIFDNIDHSFLPALRDTLAISDRADFCVGYFNLRGWKAIDQLIERWSGGEGNCCRLLVGMQRLPQEDLREALSVVKSADGIDNQTALRLKKKLAEEFREQLTVGVPTNEDEAGLRRLAVQLRARKVVVKLFVRHPLHAKLYLLFRPDPISPKVGYLGSSNLTFAGLSKQGELNIDVLDQDACQKLAQWFEDRWNDRFCWDISKELVEIIEESWARPERRRRTIFTLKMAYHLSQEARAGLTEFRLPRDFADTLFEFQIAAVKIAAHHLNSAAASDRRRGGPGQDADGHRGRADLRGRPRPGNADHLPQEPRADVGGLPHEIQASRPGPRDQPGHQGTAQASALSPGAHRRKPQPAKPGRQRYRAIQEYIRENESRVMLLTATPYNKTYIDLSNQLRLFVPEDADVGIRPENHLRRNWRNRVHPPPPMLRAVLAAFEKSEYADDWRELMRLYLVRRTRSFIQDNYAETDPAPVVRQASADLFPHLPGRATLLFPRPLPQDGNSRSTTKTPTINMRGSIPTPVVDAINGLSLPRYGLGNYIEEQSPRTADNRRGKNRRRPVPCGKTPHGVLPHQPLQATGEQWAGFYPVGRAAHPAELRLPARPGERSLVPIGTQDASVAGRAFHGRRCRLRHIRVG